MGTFLGTLIAAIVGAGTTIWATSEQNKATAAAGAEARGIANENKALTLQQQGFQNQMTQKSFAEQQRQYNNAQVKSIADDITNKANSSKLYQQQLLQMWGA